MKKFLSALFAVVLVLTLSACQECEECEECEKCEEVEECEECEECSPQFAFYETMSFEQEGYTPAYDYFLSGTLNEQGEITAIRLNMVSVYGTSKRSNDYDMNVAKFQVGGTSGNQTLNLFIGGSTENIAQVYNTIAGDITTTTKFIDVPFVKAYPQQVIAHTDEIYGLLETALDMTIDENTLVIDVLSKVGLYNATDSVIKNGNKYVELEGAWGGKNYNHQLEALETYIVTNKLTLEEAYELVSTNNQGFDNRDAVAGATVMFDAKIVKIFAKAAGVEINNDPVVIGTQVSGTDTIITVRLKGMYEMVVSVTIDDSGEITTITVISHNETENLGKKVIEDGVLVGDIIAGQANLEAVDGISGSTLTSNALIEAAKTAVSEFNK